MADIKKLLLRFSGHSKDRKKRTEELLRQESILALIPDIIMQADKKRTYIWANQSGYDFFGADVVGQPADYYFVDKQDLNKIFQPLLSGEEENVYVESWQRRQDGNKRLLAWWGKPIKSHSGKVIGTLSTARDITGQKNNEINLLQRTIELDGFFTFSLELLCVADIEGNFRRLSKHWEEVLGYPVKELEGRKFTDFVHPDDLPATIDASSAGPDPKRIVNFLNRFRHQDGSYRWLQWSSIRVGTAVFASARDITEEKRTQEALKLNEARYRNLVENSPVINYQLDINGVFLQSEGKGLDGLGLKPGEVVGTSIFDIYKNYPEILEAFEKVITGEHISFKVEVNGRTYESFMEPVYGSCQQVDSVIAVSVDQTERLQAEQETKRRNAELEQRVMELTAQLLSAQTTNGAL